MVAKVLTVVGARPQFVKVGPVSRAIENHNKSGGLQLEDILVHTGQHYDFNMSEVFFKELQLPEAQFNLNVGSGSHGKQTARMLESIEEVLDSVNPDLVVVYGDTNSTIAAALAASKLHIPVAHIEAGLRSFNRRMPEELNRIATDHLSDLLLAPTPVAMENLRREGLEERALHSGDVMLDAVQFNQVLAMAGSSILSRLSLESADYGVVTLHRAENTDDAATLRQLVEALGSIAGKGLRLIFPIHPRTAKALETAFSETKVPEGLELVPPVGYLDMLRLLDGARIALTDSGGLQKEALFLGTPCVTLRNETEWVETVEIGANVLVGSDPAAIVEAAGRMTEHRLDGPETEKEVKRVFGGPDVGETIVSDLVKFLES